MCQAKPAQLETWYPAEAWLAPATNNHPIVYHRLEILTQTCRGSHQCHGGDDIWNFVPYSCEMVNGLTVWCALCQTIKGWRWFFPLKFAIRCRGDVKLLLGFWIVTLYLVCVKALLSAAISPPFFSTMMDQWSHNQADGSNPACQASFPTFLTLSDSPLVYHVRGRTVLVAGTIQWSYEIYARGYIHHGECSHRCCCPTLLQRW